MLEREEAREKQLPEEKNNQLIIKKMTLNLFI
jgi:hypothetical protein